MQLQSCRDVINYFPDNSLRYKPLRNVLLKNIVKINIERKTCMLPHLLLNWLSQGELQWLRAKGEKELKNFNTWLLHKFWLLKTSEENIADAMLSYAFADFIISLPAASPKITNNYSTIAEFFLILLKKIEKMARRHLILPVKPFNSKRAFFLTFNGDWNLFDKNVRHRIAIFNLLQAGCPWEIQEALLDESQNVRPSGKIVTMTKGIRNN